MTYNELYTELTSFKPARTESLPPIRFLKDDPEFERKYGKGFGKREAIFLASYPRSGNTLLRGYLEKIMGLATGSDSDITKKLISQLMEEGFSGEGLVD